MKHNAFMTRILLLLLVFFAALCSQAHIFSEAFLEPRQYPWVTEADRWGTVSYKGAGITLHKTSVEEGKDWVERFVFSNTTDRVVAVQDFKAKLKARGGIWHEADRYVVTPGEEVVIDGGISRVRFAEKGTYRTNGVDHPISIELYPLSEVRLGNAPEFTSRVAACRQYLLTLKADRLLAPFRQRGRAIALG